MVSSEAIRLIGLIRKDFQTYAPRCLKIVTKEGLILPFSLNRAQAYIHDQCEDQIRRTGKVRKILLKGRQQGASTYVAGRFYYKATGSFGKNVGILTHEQKATDNLFTMVKRYHEHCPEAVRPQTAVDSAKELWFDRLDVRYKVSTAGTKGAGRSSTMHFFHGSEVAFWPNARDHMAGLGQAIPNAPETEIILESTANGIGNYFHDLWCKAVRGESEYEAIFVPWFWQTEYSLPTPDDFLLDPEEADYRDAFDLTLEQMVWRRAKINGDFQGDINLFNQEYPATPEMAFMIGSTGALISPLIVAEAAKPKKIDVGGPLIIGVDPAEYGEDSTGIVVRHGRKVPETDRIKCGPMELVGYIGNLIERLDPDAVCIDVGGSHGVADRLIELGHKNIYKINFGSKAIKEKLYINKRIEIWDEMRKWLEDQPCEIPANHILMSDLSSPGFTYDSSRRKVLESKEKMKARGVPSPDLGDALALTFAVPIMPKKQRQEPWRDRLKKRQIRQRSAMSA
jgi:hypothetical protein